MPSLKTIGIGIGDDAEKVIRSAASVAGKADVVCYVKPGTSGLDLCGQEHVRIETSPHPHEALVADLMGGKTDAAVRGTLPANETLQALKRACGVDHLERIALLETASGRKFLLTPVGVDEGWTVAEKLDLIRKGREIARRFGLPERVGILSGGRLGDIGRHAEVDASMAEAELVAKLSGSVHCEILIEDAVRTCGLIIAPDGISGNLIFRTLTFLGAGHGHGAPVLNISRIFVDTSRASPDYTNALMLAAALVD
ncbi:MAG TPA: methanogenesis marker protein Mmp4/MtxX [Methanoregulaceae archaeon]|nr:methanogenesis marker protein Mmp4/MtxX [Methanoregulaceae archaeon]HPD76099.1 methanogenesis marker protein Mmp4/MtxX [Methanoregulaceae archaeon]HRY75279.1 methanogenesis marker protein Mmp4/MtxX [Methanoregulaceae archaeon]